MPGPIHAAQFQTQYEMGLESTYGVAASTSVIQGTDEPDASLSVEANETPVVSGGTAEPQSETFVQGRSNNTAKWTARMNTTLLKVALSSLAQDNTFAGTGPPYVDAFAPFASYPSTKVGYTIRKVFGPSATPNGVLLTGALCKSLKLSSQSGQGIMLATEWQGKGGTTENAVTPSATRFPNNGAYAHTALASGGFSIGGVDMNPTKFDLTVETTTGAFYGTASSPDEVSVAGWSVKGTVSVSARQKGLGQIVNMVGGLWQAFSLGAGSGNTLWSFDGDILLTGYSTGVEDGFEVFTFNYAIAKSTTSLVWSVNTAAAFTGAGV